MKRRWMGVVALGMAMMMGRAWGAPETAVDMSSPRATLQTIYSAMRAGDLAAVKSCLIFEDAEAEEVFDCSATQVCVPLRLMHAMEKRFGAAADKLFDPAAEKSIDQALERIKSVEIAVNGETATVTEKKGDVNPNAETELTGVTLRHADGKWKVVASTFPDSGGDVSPKELALMKSMRDAQTAACRATIARLDTGEFHSAEEAYAAYQSLLQPSARAAATTSGR